MIFEQLFDAESSTYTYLVGDEAARVAVLIDPVAEQLERDLARLGALGLTLAHSLETHLHADHVTSGASLTARTGSLPVVHHASPVTCVAKRVAHGEQFTVGALAFLVLETPGHTPESVSYVLGDRVFTGDALLIGTCGRTDFQGGDPGQLFDSVHAHLFTLPGETLVFPAHDYKGKTSSTIAVERQSNTRLVGRTRAEFIELMNGLGLPPPRKMDVALPANLSCGQRPSQE
ncbi:MAG TPA: MBL fold metallo-hydrolase [Polyangia bacterium]|nr:MBL fold metallo-hydrolase [Polyangia bacterium]